MRRIGDALEKFLRFAGGALLVALLVPVAIQVFARLVPGVESPMWTEEAARYLLVWTIMVGAVVALRRGSHFVVDLLPPLPTRIDRWIARIASALVVAFGLFCAWHGMDFVSYGWEQTSEVADWPLWLIFIAWPVAGMVWAVFGVESLFGVSRHGHGSGES